MLITVIGSIQIADLTIKTYVFRVSEYPYYPESIPAISQDESKKRFEVEQLDQKKRQLSTSLSLIIVGAPLYLYHWNTIKKENK